MEEGISAPTGVEGKRFGFGTQWKDWESIWFGRVTGDETDRNSDLSDLTTNSIEATTPDQDLFDESWLKRLLTRLVIELLIFNCSLYASRHNHGSC